MLSRLPVRSEAAGKMGLPGAGVRWFAKASPGQFSLCAEFELP